MPHRLYIGLVMLNLAIEVGDKALGPEFFKQLFSDLSHSKVLVVDDEPIMLEIISGLFSDYLEVICVNESVRALNLINKHHPDLIMLDINMPGLNRIEICNRLKNDPETRDIPVIFITALDSEEQENECWQSLASDFVRKPFNHLTLAHRIHNHLLIKHQQDQLTKLSLEDPLTEIYNRRYLVRQLSKEMENSHRRNWPLSIFMLDIDHFKKYNDTYGHIEGDQCLQFVAGQTNTHLRRPGDWAARYGGEEFVGVLPDTSLELAQGIAQQLCDNITNQRIPNEGSPFAILSVSIGVAQLLPEHKTVEDLIEAADERLYLAKKSGRNQIK